MDEKKIICMKKGEEDAKTRRDSRDTMSNHNH